MLTDELVTLDVEDPLPRLEAAMAAKREVVLSGYAGSGKTTLVRRLTVPTLLLAPTGRAARRLHEVTGEDANTLHSFLFEVPDEHWHRLDGTECREVGRPCAGCACEQRLTWRAKPRAELAAGTWLVVDEASMMDEEIAAAVRARASEFDLDLGILWVGDPGQLPPVSGPCGVRLAEADVMLTKIHRTERQGILDLSTAIRSARDLSELRAALARIPAGDYPGVVAGERGWDGAAAWRAEKAQRMLVVRQNKHRIELNAKARHAAGFRGRLGVADRLLIRSNNRDAGVLNGEVFRVDEIESVDGLARVKCTDPGDGHQLEFVVVEDLLDSLDRDAFARVRSRVRSPWWDVALVNCQYGYALTCHAAQGCEAQEVGVVWTSFDWWLAEREFEDARAWLYTAVTRAAGSLTVWQVRS